MRWSASSQLGGPVADPQLQFPIERVGVALGRLQTLDEILVVESQPERGSRCQMESPRRRTVAAVKSAARNAIIRCASSPSLARRTAVRRPVGQKEREERFRTCREQRRPAEHHAADDETQEARSSAGQAQ